jgi:hypothetical protein
MVASETMLEAEAVGGKLRYSKIDSSVVYTDADDGSNGEAVN